MKSCTAGLFLSKRFELETPSLRITNRSVLLTALIIWLPAVSGQTWSVGLTTGVVPTDDFGHVESRYTTTTNRLLIGPTVRLRLPSGVGFEAGALHKGIDFDYSFGRLGLGLTEYHTRAAAWQFPMLFQYGRSSRRVAPYLNAGLSLRRITGTRQTGQSCTQLPSVVCTPIERAEAAEIENATTTGLVFGGGLEFGVAFLRLSPEVRFTRWLSQPFTAPMATENQLDVLVRVAVPIGSGGSVRR